MHKVMLGDWSDNMGAVDDGSVSLILADPPYGSTPQRWDKRWPPGKWDLFAELAAKACGDTGQLWIFVRMPWAIEVFKSLSGAGWRYVQEVVWEKQNAGGATVGTFRKVHENLWHFKRPGAKTFNLDAVRVRKSTDGNKSVKRRGSSPTQFIGVENSGYVDDGFRIPKSVQKVRNLHMSKESLGHKTQKPLSLLVPLILYSSNEGDLVLDPCCGSGSSLVAAKVLGRQAVGMEGDQEWAQKAARWLESASLEDVMKMVDKDTAPLSLNDLYSRAGRPETLFSASG